MRSFLDQLFANRFMKSPREVSAFEAALAALADSPDEGLLPDLHLVLDDSCLHHEVMFGLVHFLESFDMAAQIHALLVVLPRLVRQASEWSKVLHFRILNDNSARTCYRQLLSTTGEPSLSCARRILQEIARGEDEPLKRAAEYVLSAL